MGQGHQVYIHGPNPGPKTSGKTDSKIGPFGSASTTNYAYHNQWLYGREPLRVAARILEAVTGKEPYGTLLGKLANSIKEIADQFQKILETGLGQDNGHSLNFYPLNEEDPEITTDFTRGDNNAGITIVDSLTGKYCFMNISGRYPDYDGIYGLPSLKPLSAEQYVRAYYPLEEKHDNLETELEIAYLLERLAPYPLLTLQEVKEMFPAVYQTKLETA